MQHRQRPECALRGVVLLLVLQGALALPAATKGDADAPPFATCPVEKVVATHPAKYATLTDGLVFAIRPSSSLMYMRILVDHVLFKVTARGTTVKLLKCEGPEDICVTLDERDTKGTDILTPSQWNYVSVSLSDDRLKVDVNRKAHVMGMIMPVSPNGSYTSKVAIVATDSTAKIPESDTYSVDINIMCNDTNVHELQTVAPLSVPAITTKVPITTVKVPTHPAPYKTCPLYQVEPEHPSPYVTLKETLTVAVFPSESLLYMWIRVDDTLFKAIVNKMMVTLLMCDSKGKSCTTADEGGSKSLDILRPNRWNEVSISLVNDTINVNINMRIDVMKMIMPANFEGTHSSEVSVVASDPNINGTQEAYYTVAVNIGCNDTFSPVIRDVTPGIVPVTITTVNPLATQESIIDSTAEPSTTSTLPVGIIVGVLIALLIIIAVAIAITSYKKRRSADINQHTPLREQQQQQIQE